MAHDGLRERLLSTKPEQPGWWMVERDDGKTRPLYLTQPGGAGGWSSDWRDGFKFTNREDAEQQFELWHSAYGHVRSHSMMVEFVNPDGPEAVATIERLTEALEATRPPIVTDEVVERVRDDVREVAERLSIEAQIAAPTASECRLRAKMGDCASSLFKALRALAAMPAIPPQSLGDRFAEYINRAIQTFDSDPPATDFQRGYLAALKMVREETAAMPTIDQDGGEG